MKYNNTSHENVAGVHACELNSASLSEKRYWYFLFFSFIGFYSVVTTLGSLHNVNSEMKLKRENIATRKPGDRSPGQEAEALKSKNTDPSAFEFEFEFRPYGQWNLQCTANSKYNNLRKSQTLATL